MPAPMQLTQQRRRQGAGHRGGVWGVADRIVIAIVHSYGWLDVSFVDAGFGAAAVVTH
jgi:hypothetical protein